MTAKTAPKANLKAAVKAIEQPTGILDKLSVYFPIKKVEKHAPIERLSIMAQKADRSMNYMVCEAVIAYLEANE